MSAKRSSFGMHHVTVVPTNFTPQDGEDGTENTRSQADDSPTEDIDSRGDDDDGSRDSDVSSDAT